MTKEKRTRQQKIQAIHEEIVAYLDGELDVEQTQRVEDRLTRRPDYQRRFQQMQQAWDMLDSLPEAQVDESFSTSTLEMVAVAAEEKWQQVQTSAAGRARRTRLFGMGLMLASAAAGFLLAFCWGPRANDGWLRDLPVIENVDLYLHADNLDFLQTLHQEAIFAEEEASHVG